MSSGCPEIGALDAMAAGGGDEAVRTHVEHCDSCRERMEDIRRNNDLFDRLGTTLAGDRPREHGSSDAPPGYRLIEEVHRGAQGVVYRAEQVSTKRTVALKLLHAGRFATTAQRRRFERELDLIARMRHPNVVAVHDGGRTPDGGWFLAMEFVDGVTLDEHETGPVRTRADAERVARLFVKICDGVAHAHRHGVIHRDLKPGNVLIDAEGEPRIVDFGLARERDDQTVTRPGEFAGTLAYAAPEQVSRGESVDVRTDVYALGAMLYERLTGCRPHETAGPLREVIRRISEDSPRALSVVRGDRVVPVDLETIIVTALSHDANQRYESAGALTADLERFLAGAPIEARRASTWYMLRKAAQRHKAPAVAAGIAVLVLAGFAVAMSVAYSRAATEAAKANQIRYFLEDTLASVSPETPGEPVTVRDTLDEAVHWVELALHDQPEVEASLRNTIGNSYRVLGEYKAAEVQLQRALELRRELLGPNHPETAASLTSLGLLRRDQGRLDEAADLVGRGLAITERRWGRGHARVTNPLLNLGMIEHRRGRLDGARALFDRAIAIRLREYGPDSADTAMCWFLLARLEEERGDPEAARCDRLALEARLASVPAGHPDIARSVEALARTQELARPDERARIDALLRRVGSR